MNFNIDKCYPPIYVSLTTIPSRFNNIFKTIDSILAQSYPPTGILLHIPKKYNRFPASTISLVDCVKLFIRYSGKITIHFTKEDYGPGTKLLGNTKQMLNKFSKNSFLLLIDDDMVYNPNMIETFITNLRSKPSAYSFYTYCIPSFRQLDRTFVIGQGADGFFIQVEMLHNIHEFYQEIKINDDSLILYRNDDIWISYYLSILNIDIIMINYNNSIYTKHTMKDALSYINNYSSTLQSIKILETHNIL